MDHASDAVAPPETEVVQVGDAVWQRAQRRGLVQGAVLLSQCLALSRAQPAVLQADPYRPENQRG